MSGASIPTYRILGVPVAQQTGLDVVTYLRALVDAREGRCRSLAFANSNDLTEATLDGGFRSALEDADLVLPDGMPLVWASRRLGSCLRERCYGPGVMRLALEASAAARWRHFFYGSTDRVLDALRETVSRRYPGAVVCGALAAPFGPLQDTLERSNIERINASGADLLWVGLGCPRQVLWMQRYREQLRVSAVLGVGAAFDFLAGLKPQAPRWMQQAGLEWAFRLGCEPRRLWRRYLLRGPRFVWEFALQLAGVRWRHP
ncbi:MAG: glycosyltransferase [Gemmatimonadales bacterium]|nr:MAG: glycosyltransferase [Gemmatimonadales bacterium]